ncbi:CHAD domain-containing protein [Ruegeria sp. HKCCSP351]|uniref:CHAD domain-containing protein n=1 Tax=Ruegeria sp. HKCCSP351 TaxID=2794832 RepID=UPI001AE4B59B|nr:CHAD domain-containing protein [Ruegeria sp. HKCCSP351]
MTRSSGDQFIFPARIDETALANAIAGFSQEVSPGSPVKAFALLDCHDQSLRASGRALIDTGGVLHLLRKDHGPLSQQYSGHLRFVRDLSEGPVQKGLSDFPELRALTRIGVGEIRVQTFAVLDDLQKTKVRGTLTYMSTPSGQATIVRIQKLRGYKKAYQLVCSSIASITGSVHDIETLYSSLIPDMVPYQAKPEIKFGQADPSIEVAAKIIQTYLRVARQNEEGVIADIDTEFLHDYRVSLRKIRSVISLFKGVLSESQTTELKRVFSDLMTRTGPLRDLDVYLLEKDKYFNLIPPNLHVGLSEMFDQLQTERAQEQLRLSRWLHSADYTTTMTDLTALFASPDHLDLGPNAHRGTYDYACALIWKRYRKVCKLARGITVSTPDKTVHDLRIECKKLRYLMELFDPLFDWNGLRMILKPLKKLQDSLGLFNDYSVQQDALLTFVASRADTQGRVDAQIGLSVGGLIAVLDQRKKTERMRVVASFHQFDGQDVRHMFRSQFHHKVE